MENPYSLKIATTLGLVGASALGGVQLSISAFAIPSMLQSPAQLGLRQWRRMYDVGAAVAPPFSAVAAASLGYVAYSRYQANSEDGTWKSLALAAVGTVAVVPFTILVLLPTNNRLIAGSDGTAKLAEKEIQTLIARWGNLNYVRGLLPITAAAVGLWSVLS